MLNKQGKQMTININITKAQAKKIVNILIENTYSQELVELYNSRQDIRVATYSPLFNKVFKQHHYEFEKALDKNKLGASERNSYLDLLQVYKTSTLKDVTVQVKRTI